METAIIEAGSELSKKRRLATELHVFLFACLLYVPVLLVAVTGMALTQARLVRGDSQTMSTAFVASIGLPVIDIALIIVYSWCMCEEDYDDDITPHGVTNYFAIVCLNLIKTCKFLCAFFSLVFALLASAVAGLATTGLATYSAWDEPYLESAGCQKGFGCANIMALIVAGEHALLIIIWLFISCFVVANRDKLRN